MFLTVYQALFSKGVDAACVTFSNILEKELDLTPEQVTEINRLFIFGNVKDFTKLGKKCKISEKVPRARNAYQAFLADTSCRKQAEELLRETNPDFTRKQYLKLIPKKMGHMWKEIKEDPERLQTYKVRAKQINEARGFDTNSASVLKTESKKTSLRQKKKVVEKPIVTSDSEDEESVTVVKNG